MTRISDRTATQTEPTSPGGRTHNVVVIGGGVVGCAVLRSFALAGLEPLMLERGPDILSGASKANSALLHTGYDATPGSLELACVRDGYSEYLSVRERLGLPLLQTSAIMIAWDEDEASRLPELVERARRCGVTDVRAIGRDELYQREPNLARHAVQAVLVPGEHVIDPWSAPLAYALQAQANGATIRRNSEVTGGQFVDGIWHLETTLGPVRARVVVNCSGLFGDIVEAICRPSPFEIRPRKGQFVVFDKPAFQLVSATILAVPNKRTKGVLLARTAFGNLLLGPTAEEQDDRENASVNSDVLSSLVTRGRKILPALESQTITATFAGLRPATQHSDYQIEALPERQWISVSGIRSTGLTGSLGIARHVRSLYEEHFSSIEDLPDPAWIRVPNLCEADPRPYQGADCGEIVCHCEWVTCSEIKKALTGPLPAGDIGGLRRRTRCMMGRCQGFYCSARVAEIAAGLFEPGLTTRIAS